MTFYCKVCQKSMMNKSKFKHIKSITQKTLDNSVVRRYLTLNPYFDQFDEILKR